MNVTIDLMNASSETMLPSTQQFCHWAEAALAAATGVDVDDTRQEAELSIRIVDEAESASLNANFRHKQGPTNILSFPGEAPPGTGINLLGDLAICAPLVTREAQEQDKTPEAHWAHLTVHGVLHLTGYDHEEPAEAEQMESLEIGIMDSLGYGNPYDPEGKDNE